MNGELRIGTDKGELDVPLIHRFLSTEAYWSPGIPRETVERAIAGSLCFGGYVKGAGQVAFARVISDFATFAYLSDVFVLPEHRGNGLGKWLIRTICGHPDLRELKNICLITRTPQFYEPMSFAVLSPADVRKFMMQTKPAFLPPTDIPG